jgi:ribosomal protection tetracycline resistance protein
VSTLNLGIVAHVDAGKTSLTERLLFAAGVIDDIGRVDDGNTQTDTMALERQRGMSIKSAVVSFAVGGLTVNLIDTPGHPDFIAEVERTLAVLDGAVLVISAVEGVQAQTRVLMRALRRLALPTLILVNKIDRAGARDERVLAIFKIERGPAGEKIAYARMFSGTVRTRDQLRFGGDQKGRVTAISVFEHGLAAPRACVTAGQIGKLWGLSAIRIGDTLRTGDALSTGGTVGRGEAAAPGRHFAPPSLETVVVPARPADREALRAALGQLAEQDPLINVRQDDARQEISVSLYGEVQKEVIQATLAADFGLDAGFRETTTICIERPAGEGSAAEFMGEPANPFRATVGLRIVPAPAGSGVRFRLGIERGALPAAFQKAVEETVRQTLREGLRGWQVTDAAVTLTHSGFTPPPPSGWSKVSSSAGDFRNLTPLVLMSALRQAGTRVYEPVHRFHLEAPADTAWSVLPALARLGAIPDPLVTQGSLLTVTGDIPAAQVHELTQQLPALTHGAGVLEATFGYYRLARDPLSRSGGRSGSAGRRPPRHSSLSPRRPAGTAGT